MLDFFFPDEPSLPFLREMLPTPYIACTIRFPAFLDISTAINGLNSYFCVIEYKAYTDLRIGFRDSYRVDATRPRCW